jgi:membrane-bound lytic murein transglycosylase D
LKIITSIPRLFISFALITSISFSAINVNAQATVGSSSNSIPNEVEKQDPRVTELINKAEEHFKRGKANLDANKRYEAREEFDKAIDVILNAGINVIGNPRLRDYYYQLVQRIYLEEVPQQKTGPNTGATFVNVSDNSQQGNAQDQIQTGFKTQDFQPPFGDELAKIQIAPDEANVTDEQLRDLEAAKNGVNFSFNIHPLVQQFINFYQGPRGRRTMEVGIYRSGQFMKMARKIFREEGVPEDIVWLGQVESAWIAQARSWAGASGLWQFIRGTGSRFGLQQTAYLDERNGFEKATRASAKYLKWLADRYGGNWELAMAAYNCGEGNTDNAISRAGVANFWAAYPYLPLETRNYVPNILAVILINKSPGRYGFGHIKPAPPLAYDVIQMPGGVSLKLIADLTDSTHDWLRYLNPELKQAKTPVGLSYPVRVPAGKAKELVAAYKKLPANKRDNVTIRKVNPGESLETIAKDYNVSIDEVKAWAVNFDEKKGYKLVVPDSKKMVQPIVINRAVAAKTVKAQKGDTVRKIASRLGVNMTELLRANGILNADAELPVGRELKVPAQVSQPRSSRR